MHGCILGGDGSGGQNSRDPRTRRCGFGLVAIRPDPYDNSNFQYLGHVYGEVPGKQSVPRSEGTALPHACKHTSGNCEYVIDAYGCMTNYNKGSGYQPVSNGLLWQAINIARQERLAEGRGHIELVWIESHQSLEHAVNSGWSILQWTANWYADKLADKAAKRYQLAEDHIEKISKTIQQAVNLLKRHVDLAIAVAPARPVRHSNRTAEDLQQASIVQAKGSREQQIRQLA